jgi:FGGY-family pentulose kinase/HAD superfamily hydrolase (TIGR01509 family)
MLFKIRASSSAPSFWNNSAMRNFDLIIFDCDGVLVDSENLAMGALLEIVAEAGLKLDAKEAQGRFLGRSLASIREILESHYGLTLTGDALELMRQRLYASFRRELEPIDDIIKTLRHLNIPFCVASSSQMERMRLSLEVTGLLPAFEGKLFSTGMVAQGKPAPDLFLLAAKTLKAKPERCLVIEDSPAGVMAAKRAGMSVFGFTGGSHARSAAHHDALRAVEPDMIFSEMARLPQFMSKHVRKPIDQNQCFVVAVDVGTGSARAGVLDKSGRMAARAQHPILMRRHGADHAEHDSQDIWRAVCLAVKEAVARAGVQAGVDASAIHGIGFDATCSLVVRGKQDEQVCVSLDGEANWDTIVWLDHRAKDEADQCTATGHGVLAYLGGVMSPEMQTPKLMWLKKHRPDSWNLIGHVYDLTDFLTWKASGSRSRSQCTLTCKWTYLAHEKTDQSSGWLESGWSKSGWQRDFFATLGLGEFHDEHLAGLDVRPVGHTAGTLSQAAAHELGLSVHCKVGIGLIDAFGGTLGVIGGYADGADGIDRHLALIAGTSSCVTTLSKTPRPVHGIWGPYLGAALSNYWLNEGGQSATGALLDHIIRQHGAGGEPDAMAHARITARIMEMRESEGLDLAGRLNVLPDFHGNRSPLADPRASGVISGLSLDAGFDSLCKLYWRTAVSIALGVRHILDALNEHGYGIDTLHVTGGHTKNSILMELYCDATGCTVIEPLADDATLLGTAMVAATAAGLYPDLNAACVAMHQGGTRHEPNPAARARFDKDYAVFLEMHRQRKLLDGFHQADGAD